MANYFFRVIHVNFLFVCLSLLMIVNLSAYASGSFSNLSRCAGPLKTTAKVIQHLEYAKLNKVYPGGLLDAYKKAGLTQQQVESVVHDRLAFSVMDLKNLTENMSIKGLVEALKPYQLWEISNIAYIGADLGAHEADILPKMEYISGVHRRFFLYRDIFSEKGWEEILSKIELKNILEFLPYFIQTGDLRRKVLQGRLAQVSPQNYRFLSLATLPISKLPNDLQKKAMERRVRGSTYSKSNWDLKHLPLGTCPSDGCSEMQVGHLGGVDFEKSGDSSVYSGKFFPVYYKGEIMGSLKTKGDKTFLAWKTLPSKKEGGFSLVAGGVYRVPSNLSKIAELDNKPKKIELTEVGLPSHFTPLKFLMGGTYWPQEHSSLVNHLNRLIKEYE